MPRPRRIRVPSDADRVTSVSHVPSGQPYRATDLVNLARIEMSKSCKDRKDQILQGSNGTNLARIDRSKSCKDRKDQHLQGSKGAKLARIERSKSCNDRNQQQKLSKQYIMFFAFKIRGLRRSMGERSHVAIWPGRKSNKNILKNIECFLLSNPWPEKEHGRTVPTTQLDKARKTTKNILKNVEQRVPLWRKKVVCLFVPRHVFIGDPGCVNTCFIDSVHIQFRKPEFMIY